MQLRQTHSHLIPAMPLHSPNSNIHYRRERHCYSDSRHGRNFPGWWMTAYDRKHNKTYHCIYFSNKTKGLCLLVEMSLNYTWISEILENSIKLTNNIKYLHHHTSSNCVKGIREYSRARSHNLSNEKGDKKRCLLWFW